MTHRSFPCFSPAPPIFPLAPAPPVLPLAPGDLRLDLEVTGAGEVRGEVKAVKWAVEVRGEVKAVKWAGELGGEVIRQQGFFTHQAFQRNTLKTKNQKMYSKKLNYKFPSYVYILRIIQNSS